MIILRLFLGLSGRGLYVVGVKYTTVLFSGQAVRGRRMLAFTILPMLPSMFSLLERCFQRLRFYLFPTFLRATQARHGPEKRIKTSLSSTDQQLFRGEPTFSIIYLLILLCVCFARFLLFLLVGVLCLLSIL